MIVIESKGFKVFRSTMAFFLALIMIVGVFAPGVVTYAEGNEDEEETVTVETDGSSIDDGTGMINTDSDDTDFEETLPETDVDESDDDFGILDGGDESDDGFGTLDDGNSEFGSLDFTDGANDEDSGFATQEENAPTETTGPYKADATLPNGDLTATIPTGQLQSITVIRQASAGVSYFVAIPVDVAKMVFQSNSVTGTIVNNPGFIAGGTVVTGDFFVFHVEAGSGSAASIPFKYGFIGGTTKAGDTWDVTAYALPSIASGGSGWAGSGYDIDTSKPVTVSGYTVVLTASTDEDFDVAKTLVSGSNGNTDLISKEYQNCGIGTDHALVYQIDVTTTGNGNSSGRVYQNDVSLTDTISDLVAAPNSIIISTNSTFGDADDVTLNNTDFTYAAGTCTFDIPVVNSSTAPFANQTFWVKVIVEEDDYTAMHGAAGAITEAVTINNSAYLENTPVISSMATNHYESEVDAYLGFKQSAPDAVNFVIQKQVSINGAVATDYGTTLQGIYGDATNPVEFTLTPTTGAPVSGIVDGNGKVTLAVEPATTYTLTESTGISSMFTNTGDVTVVVSPRKPNGSCDITIGGVAYDGTYEAVNTTETASSIKVIAQTKDVHTGAQTNVPNGHEIYVQLNGTTIKAGTTTSGVVIFEGLEAGVEYTITGAGITNFTTPTVTATPEDGSYSDSQNTYSLIYTNAGGSFILNKGTTTIDGSPIALPAGHTATFELVKMNGATPSEDPADKHTITYPTNVNTNTGIVSLTFPAGTYRLTETSSTPVGQYKDNNKTATVTIEAGKVDATLSGAAISGGFFLNESNHGILRIVGKSITDGNYSNLKYTVKNASGVDVATNVSVDSTGKYEISLPAGIYTVSQTSAEGYPLIDSEATTVTVVAGTAASGTVSISTPAVGTEHELVVSGLVQTAVFLNAKLPTITAGKTNAATSESLPDAGFTLYKLNDGGTAYDVTTKMTASTSLGDLSFTNVEKGTYILVETTVPNGYNDPAYYAAIMPGGTLLTSIPVTSSTGIPVITVEYDDYSGTTTATEVELLTSITNVPLASFKFGYGSTTEVTLIAGTHFTITKAGGSSEDITTTTSLVSINNLTPGVYTITQTSSADGFVMREGLEITVTVDENGVITHTTAMDWISDFPNSRATSVNGSLNELVVSNRPMPIISFQKFGETYAIDESGNRKTLPLKDVEFIVSCGTKGYLKTGANGEATYVANQDDATVFTSNAEGKFMLSMLNPNDALSYKIIEVNEEPVNGAIAGMTYPKKEWTVTLAPTADGASYAATLSTGGTSLGTGTEANPVDLLNIIKSSRIEINKNIVDEDEGEIEPTAGNSNNAVFAIFKDNGNDPLLYTDLVDIVVTGTGALGVAGQAISCDLPAGNYILVEVQKPHGGASDSDIYTESGGIWTATGFDVSIPAIERFAAGTYKAISLEIEETDLNNGNKSITIGNMAASSGGTSKYARFYGLKKGYSVSADGTLVFDGALNNVQFDVSLAYKSNSEYVILTKMIPVTSGSMQGSDGKIVNGAFLTEEVEILSRIKTLSDVMEEVETTGECIITLAFVLDEKGPLPSNYEPWENVEYYDFKVRVWKDSDDVIQAQFVDKDGINITGSIVVYADVGVTVATNITPVEIKNITDKASITVRKVNSSGNALANETTAAFDLYRSTDAAGTDRKFVETINAGPTAIDVAPGYYWLRETTAPDGYNKYGSYTFGAENGTFAADTVFGPFLITAGGVMLPAVEIQDTLLAEISILNYWNAATTTNNNYQASYVLTYSETAGGTYTTVTSAGTDGKFTINRNDTKTISNLADGFYKLVETGISATASNFYFGNDAATSGLGGGIVFQVADGKATVVQAKSTAGGALANVGTGAANKANFTASNEVLGAVTGGAFTTIRVNHKPQTALIVNKGLFGADGNRVTGSTGITNVVFGIEKKNGANWESLPDITWTGSAVRTVLGDGTFRIWEKSVNGQTTTNDYTILDTKREFILAAHDVKYINTNGVLSDAAATFDNKTNYGVVAVYPVNSTTTTTVLPGATITLKHDVTGEVITLTYDTTSMLYTANAKPGIYTVVETVAPTGYSINSTPYKVTVIANTDINYDGLGDAGNVNTIGILHGAFLSMSIGKLGNYPAVSFAGKNVAAETPVVPGVTMTLYKKNGVSWEATDKTGATDASGLVSFTNLDVGTYRVVESIPAGTLEHLVLNGRYDTTHALGDNEFTIAYNSDFSALVITFDATTDTGDWDTNTNKLTITNEVQGVYIAVKKIDFDTGVALKGAEFKLYEDAACTGTVLGTATTGEDGFAVFGPIVANAGKIFYVKETGAPSGYIYDTEEFYGKLVQTVIVEKDENTYLRVFENKKSTDTIFAISKDVDPLTISEPLSKEGFTAQYTITPSELKNNLPIADMSIVDDGPIFKGGADNSITINGPTYKITKITIDKSTAITSTGVKTSTETPVYASIDGWITSKLLSGTTEFVVDIQSGGFEIQYSMNATGTEPVDSHFKPGKIVVDIIYNQYSQSGTGILTNEVAQVVNEVYIAVASSSKARDDAATTVAITPRATATLTKELNNPYNLLVPGEDAAQYMITLTNTTATQFVKPIIVDILPIELSYILDTGGKVEATVVAPSGSGAYTTTQGTGIDSSMVMWSFNGVLEQGESIVIIIEAKLANVITAPDKVMNNAYATSMADLIFSTEAPTGASFNGSPEITKDSAGTVFNRLNTLIGSNRGKYLTAFAEGIEIKTDGIIKNQRLISADGLNWTTNTIDVYPGGEVHYLLQVMNYDATPINNIVIGDLLPYDTDLKYWGESRGTEWDAAFIAAWKAGIGTITVTKNGVPMNPGDYTIYRSNATNWSNLMNGTGDSATGTNGFRIVFDNDVALSKEYIDVQFKIKVPEWVTHENEILESLRKESVANFLLRAKWTIAQLDIESNTVQARLMMPPVKITGTVWDDDNRDGVLDSNENARFDNLTVNLYKSIDGGATWGITPFRTTTTGTDGKYEFLGLETSYGEPQYAPPVYKVEIVHPGTALTKFSTNGFLAFDALSGNSSTNVKPDANHDFASTATPMNLYRDSVVNAGLYTLSLYNVHYVAGAAGSSATDMPNPHLLIPEGDGITVRPDVVGVKVPQWPNSSRQFLYWKVLTTEANLGKANYDPGDTFNVPAMDVYLEAVWSGTPPIGNTDYRVVYDGNGTTINVPPTVRYSGGIPVTVESQIPVREGYVFKGWNRDSTTVNNAGDTFTMPYSDVLLVAIWEQAPTDLTLMLSKDLRDIMNVRVGNGIPFRVQIFDSAMNLFADVIVPANGASISVTGLVSGETYTVREVLGEGFELQGYQLGGQFVAQETVSFIANNTGNVNSIISIVVCNMATDLENIEDPGDPSTDLPDSPSPGDDDDVIILDPESPLGISPGSPKTGDDTNLGFYIGIMVAAAALIALLIPSGKRRKKKTESD